MDGYRFDRITKRLARVHVSRRAALRSGGLGVSATILAALGFAANSQPTIGQTATPAATPTDAMRTEDGWLCKQQYALCTTAPCERAEDDATTVTCRCLVEDGYSFGFTACADRTPSGDSLISTFSTQDVTAKSHELSCPEGDIPWANCLDMPCKIDPNDPKQASCQCQVVESGAFVTMGGECDATSCSSTIWSGNYPTSPVVPQYTSAMKQIKQQVTLPQACPSASATPAST